MSPAPPTVVVADDSVLFRRGLVMLLETAGVTVLAEAGDVDETLAAVGAHRPQVAIVDIRMPPTHTDEGIQAAIRIREEYPGTGVLVLSTYAEPPFAIRLLDARTGGAGYLLKDRVDDVATLVDALTRIGAGGTAIDEEVVTLLLAGRRGQLDALTTRERAVLAMLAEGRSNVGIGHRLFLAPKSVERHIAAVFTKLGLDPGIEDNRRVLAALHYLRADRPF